MISRVFILPRWAGGPADDWYPWLKTTLETAPPAPLPSHRTLTAEVVPMPNWDSPDVVESIDFLLSVLPPDALGPQVALVGHSVGCQLIIRYLAHVAELARAAGEVPPQVGAVLCVAGWFGIDQPWQTVRNWIDLPVDYAAAQRLIPPGKLVVLLANDDPYTSDYRDNERLWRQRLGAHVLVLHEKQHFSATIDLEILRLVRALIEDDSWLDPPRRLL